MEMYASVAKSSLLPSEEEEDVAALLLLPAESAEEDEAQQSSHQHKEVLPLLTSSVEHHKAYYARSNWLRAVRYATLSAERDVSIVSSLPQQPAISSNESRLHRQQQQSLRQYTTIRPGMAGAADAAAAASASSSYANQTLASKTKESATTAVTRHAKKSQASPPSMYACDICRRAIGACTCFDYRASVGGGGGVGSSCTTVAPDACLDRNATFVFQFGVIDGWPPASIPPVDNPPVFQMVQDATAASIWYVSPAPGFTMAQVEQRFGFDVYMATQQEDDDNDCCYCCDDDDVISRSNAALALTATSPADLLAEQEQTLVGTLVHITGFSTITISNGIYVVVNPPSSVEPRYVLRRVNMFGNLGGLTGVFNVNDPNPNIGVCCNSDRWIGDWCCCVVPNVGDDVVYSNIRSRFPIRSVDPAAYNFEIDENARGDVWQLIDVQYAITCSS